jgi:hypothetical protein
MGGFVAFGFDAHAASAMKRRRTLSGYARKQIPRWQSRFNA